MSQELHHALGAFHSNLGNLLGHLDQMDPDELSMLALALNAAPGNVRDHMARALAEAGSDAHSADVDPFRSEAETDVEKARVDLIWAAINSQSVETLAQARELIWAETKARATRPAA